MTLCLPAKLALMLCVTGSAFSAEIPRTSPALIRTWSQESAANYLDSRQTWWMQWPKAQRDHQTVCVSCHTAVPYALARPTLRVPLKEHAPSIPETKMLAYIRRRVNLWSEVKPFYNDEEEGPQKTIESSGTEAVLNALILTRYDEQRGGMSQVTRKAFNEMWAAQISNGSERGSWNWLNFHNAPWESNESHYYGATLAAIAVGFAPAHYRHSPEVQINLRRLSTYLSANFDSQPLVNKIVLLWASSRLPILLSVNRRVELVRDILAHQEADGGWSLSTLGQWKRNDDTPLDTRSDGYATGLTIYAMQEAGVASNSTAMQKGISWLQENQDSKVGLWPAYSLNKQRDAASDVGRFMSDAATGYSVMALEAGGR